MYISEIDNLIDNTLNNIYYVWKDKENKEFIKLKEIINNKNFVKLQKEINVLLEYLFSVIDDEEIQKLVKKVSNIHLITEIIKKYICYYVFITIGINYKGSEDLFNNNLIELSKYQKNFKVMVDNFFTSDSNSIIIKNIQLINDIGKFLSNKKISPILQIFIDQVGQDKMKIFEELRNKIKKEDDYQHYIIKTIIYLNIFKESEKTELFKMIEEAELENEEFIYIDVVIPKGNLLGDGTFDFIDIKNIDEVMSADEKRKGLNRIIYDLLNKDLNVDVEYNKSFLIYNYESKIQKLLDTKFITPITDDFLLYNKETEKYDKIIEDGDKEKTKKREDTKLKYIVDKINLVKEFYKNPEKYSSLFYKPLIDKYAVLVNEYENTKIALSIEKITTALSKEMKDLMEDFNSYRLYPYIPFNQIPNDESGFPFSSNTTLDALRYVNFIKDIEHTYSKVQKRVISEGLPQANIVGFSILTNTNDLRHLELVDMVDISKNDTVLKDVKKHINRKIRSVILNEEILKKDIYWIFNFGKQDVKIPIYNMSSNNTEFSKQILSYLYNYSNEKIILAIKELIEKRSDKYIPSNIELINDFIRKYEDISNPEYSQLFNDLLYYICFENQKVIKNLYDKNEDVFYGLDKNEHIYKLKKIDSKENIKTIPNFVIIDMKPIDKKVKKTERISKDIALTSICQHEIDLKDLKYNTNKVYEFLDQYAELDIHSEYVCRSCNSKIDISRYLAEARFDDKKQSYLLMDVNISFPLETYKEYENYKQSIKSLDMIIQRIAYVVNYVSIRTNEDQQRVNRRTIIRDVIDLTLENNRILEKTGYAGTRNKLLEKYHIKKNTFFVFSFDDNIFIKTSKSADIFQITKYNNMVNYILVMLIFNISESQILSLAENKECNYMMFKKNIDKIFGDSEIIINRELDKNKIVNYPILCYLIYTMSCFITRYNIWGTKSEKKMDPSIQVNIINMAIELINIILSTQEKDINKNYKYLYERLFAKFYLKLDIFKSSKIIDILDERYALNEKTVSSGQIIKESDEFDQSIEKEIKYEEDLSLWKVSEMYSTKRLTCPLPENFDYLYSSFSNLTNCKTGHYHEFNPENGFFKCGLCDQKTNIEDMNPKETSKIEDKIQLMMMDKLTELYCPSGKRHNFIKDVCKLCGYDRSETERKKLSEKELISMYQNILTNKYDIVEEHKKFVEGIKAKNDKLKNFVKKTLDKMVFKFQKFNSNLNKTIDTFLDSIHQIIGIDIQVNNTFYHLYDNIYEIVNDFDGTKLAKPMRISEKDVKIIDNHPVFKTNVIVVSWKKTSNYEVYFSEENKKLLGYKQQGKDIIKSNKICNIRLLYSVKNMLYYFGCLRKRIILNDLFPEMCQMDKTKLDDFMKNLNQNMLVNKIAGMRFNNIKKLGMELQKYISRFKHNYKLKLTYPPYYKSGLDEKLTEFELLQYNNKLDLLYYNTTRSGFIKLVTENKTDKNDHVFLKHFNTMYNNMAFENIKTKDKFTDNVINGDTIIKQDYSSNLVMNYIVDEMNRLVNYNSEKRTKITIITFMISLVVDLFNTMNFDVIYENQELASFKQWLFSGELGKILSANILFEEPIDYYGLDTETDKEELSEEDRKDLEEQELEDEETSNTEYNDFHEDNDEKIIDHEYD